MTETSTRQRKTPEQRATEALEMAQRKQAKAEKALATATQAKKDAKAALTEAKQRVEYLAQDPALPESARTAPAQPVTDEDDD